MIVRTRKEEAFGYLSTQAKLKVELNKAKSEQEKFILYVHYASLIAQEEFLESAIGKSPKNHDVKDAVIGTIKWYLDEGMSPDTVDENNRSALSYAVSSPEIVELLLSLGANPNLKSSSGNTPLHAIACMLTSFYTNQLLKSAMLLTAAGANPDLKNEDGETPIEWIFSVSSKAEVEEAREKFVQATMPGSMVLTRKVSGGDVLGAPQPELPLQQGDITDIELFEAGAYKQLLHSKPLYRYLKNLITRVFGDNDSSSSEEDVEYDQCNITVTQSQFSDPSLTASIKEVMHALSFFKPKVGSEEKAPMFDLNEELVSLNSLN